MFVLAEISYKFPLLCWKFLLLCWHYASCFPAPLCLKLCWHNRLKPISDIVTKASRTLNFIKCNLSKCSSQVKESTYLTMIRLQLEYASDVWDPHYVGDIMELEKVQ